MEEKRDLEGLHSEGGAKSPPPGSNNNHLDTEGDSFQIMSMLLLFFLAFARGARSEIDIPG